MPKQMQRRLAAIMFTDIVGYSSMMQKNEALASKLRSRHREVFNRLHEKYNGEIIQYFGDGTLSIFNSTADAVECAIELQIELKKTPQVPIRIGIHTGDISYNDEEVIGDGVNIAARIESQSVPGGIFISGKAHDDIKNLQNISTRPIGQSELKNIQQPIDLYAITNAGITVPDYQLELSKPVDLSAASLKKGKKRKKKWAAALLAFFFGIFGLHRFYLDQRNLGILYITLFFLGAFIFPGAEQLIAIPAILGFVDFLIFATGSRASFDEKYNKEIIQQQEQQKEIARAKANDPKTLLLKQRMQYIEQAKAAYKNFDYEQAIESLVKAIEIKYDDPETHFLLARCFSVLEDPSKALEHLDIAVAFGFHDFERIKKEDDLAFTRIQPEYAKFASNNYQIPKEQSFPKQNQLKQQETESSDLLDQLTRLKKERQEGLLSEEEFKDKEKQLKSREIDEK
ncbi:MAG: NINE protein [Bacteroidota bacterium]